MAQRQQKVGPKRGEVFLVNFDPVIGAEIKKTRPALILQNDIANRYSPITIVAAITSRFETTVSYGSPSSVWRRRNQSCFRNPPQPSPFNRQE